MKNPALHETPREQPAAVIPVQRDASILDWLEGTGRLLAREPAEIDLLRDDEAEINELMASDDSSFDLDDDDDDFLEVED
jgi:Protein of unknown function (DUF3134)